MIKIKVGNKKYPTYYNPERQEWINSLPIGWSQKRIAFNAKLLTGFAFKSEQFAFDEGIQLVRGDNVTEGSLRWGNKERLWPMMGPEYENLLLEENDIVIGMDGSKVGKNYAMIKKEDLPLLLVQRVARLRVDEGLDPKFLYYCIGNKLFLYWITINKTDPMVPHITPKDITNYEIAFPSLAEQTIIAQFLDKKTSQIDKLIEQKEKLLKLLTEKRTAIITQAVTKGLDPTVEMKDSRIDWLGEIPKHWIPKKLKFLTEKIIDGTHSTPEYISEGIPFLRVTDIVKSNNGELDFDNFKFISEDEHSELTKRCKPEYGDLLYSKNGTIGISRVVDWDFDFSIFVSLCLIKIKKEILITSFLDYSLQSKLTENQISIGSKKSAVINLHLEKIKEFVIPYPPIEEQRVICEWLNEHLPKFKKSEDKLSESINKLKEYREALITSAVTGQIDIRK